MLAIDDSMLKAGKMIKKPHLNCWKSPGYIKKSCRSVKKKLDSMSVSYETFLSEAHVSDANKCFKLASKESQVSSDNVWLLDSGADSHISKNEKFFTTLPSDVGGELIVANSAKIKNEGSGIVMFKFGNRKFQMIATSLD